VAHQIKSIRTATVRLNEVAPHWVVRHFMGQTIIERRLDFESAALLLLGISDEIVRPGSGVCELFGVRLYSVTDGDHF
jgi:hypothetical protein